MSTPRHHKVDKHFLGNFSTLPLTKEVVLHHYHLVSEMNMFPSSQRLRENVNHLLLSRYVLQLNNSPLNIISEEVISDLYVFRPIMKHWILREPDATLIVTVNDCRPQLLIKQVYHQLAKPTVPRN